MARVTLKVWGEKYKVDSKIIEFITSERINRVKKGLDSLEEDKSVIRLVVSIMFWEVVLAFCA